MYKREIELESDGERRSELVEGYSDTDDLDRRHLTFGAVMGGVLGAGYLAAADFDKDGASNMSELLGGSKLMNPDSDGDGIMDGSDPVAMNPDADGDGLLDGLDPDSGNPDTDGDGIGDMVDPYPTRSDYDNDGLLDGKDPDFENPDIDGDGLLDGADPYISEADHDADGLLDGQDPDLENPDVDGDGLLDGDETNACIYNPDCDNDLLIDGEDPNTNSTDSDGDGLMDGFDLYPRDADHDGDGNQDGSPALRDYSSSSTGLLRHARDAHEYVDPDDPVVLGYANRLEIENDELRLADGTDLFQRYERDIDQFNDTDYWVNPDHYLANGRVGDCEDYALTASSILIARGNPSMVVVGFTEPNNEGGHAWLETDINGTRYVVDYDSLVERDAFYESHTDWNPLYAFNDEVEYGDYEADWATA